MISASYNFEKTIGGDEIASIYAVQDGTYSNEIITKIMEYTLTIDGTSYSSLSDPTSELSWSVDDEMDVYADGTGNDSAYLAYGQILKGVTDHSAGLYKIDSINYNSSSISTLHEKDIKDNDVVLITLSAVVGGGSND